MKKTSFLVAIFIGTSVYVVLNLFLGASGLWAERQLLKQKNALSYNVSLIRKINDELELEHAALLEDDELIGRYAHKLDFIYDGECLVKVEGVSYSEKPLKIGKSYLRDEIKYIPDWILKILGIACFLISIIISIVFKLRDKENLYVNTENYNGEVTSGNF